MEGLNRFLRCSICLLCLQVLGLLLCLVLGFELLSVVGALFPLLCLMVGYWLPGKFCPKKGWQTVLTLVFWTVVPALYCFWAERTGFDGFNFILPQQCVSVSWFYSSLGEKIYAGNFSTLWEPILTAAGHLLVMLGFAVGMWCGRRQER